MASECCVIWWRQIMRCLHRALNLWYQSYLCFRLQPDIKAINTNRNLSKYKSIMSRLQLILSYFQRAHLLSSNVGVAQKDHCWKPWQNSFSAVSYGRRACSYRVSGGSICLPVFFDLTTVAILEGVSYSICVRVSSTPATKCQKCLKTEFSLIPFVVLSVEIPPA